MKERKSEGRDTAAVARRLILTRQVMGMQQNEFAEAAGIKTNTYNQWENAVGKPDLEGAHKLCDGHGLTLDWIYRGDASGLKYDLAQAIKMLRQARRQG